MKLPPQLIALDALGTVLVGLGLAERFAGTNLIPGNLQFANYDIAMILVGIALMVPMLKHVISHAKANAGKIQP